MLLGVLDGATEKNLAGIYEEIAEQVGIKNAYILYNHFKGQQLNFPLKFYSSEYIAQRICEEYNGYNIRDIIRKYGYSESRVRQILAEYKK